MTSRSSPKAKATLKSYNDVCSSLLPYIGIGLALIVSDEFGGKHESEGTMKLMRRVTPGSLAAALLGLSCALATSALIARQQALADEGPTAIGNAEFAGEIRPAGETVLTAPAAVLITKTLTSIGDRVATGPALVEVDDTQARAALAAAELNLTAATRRV